MKLRFLAREDGLARMPGVNPGIGQAPMYVGRTFVPASGKTPASYPAVKNAHEVDVSAHPVADVERFKDLARKGDIWCADEATAMACGAKFVPVEFRDGAWLPKPSPKDSPK